MFSKAIAVSALAAGASAHMIMNYPTPFGVDSLNSSPLGPSDFPCKQRNGVYAVDTMNQWNAGETQKVSFNGTAVHGGGSCQFSITTDPEPTENSQWKVIQSVIGGCPTAGTDKNYDDPPVGQSPNKHRNPDEFPVTMPADIPEGRYTFAWTWMNKVGNREFYMNCAPIQVGNKGSTASTASAAKALSALPDMFVANLPADSCTSSPSTNFVYPNPGKAVSQLKQDALSTEVTGSGCAAQAKLGVGSGEVGSPSAGTPSTPSEGSPSAPSEGTPSKPSGGNSAPVASPINKGPSESKAPLNPGGVFAPGASSAPAAPTAQPAQPTQPAPPAEKPAPPAAQPVPSAAPQAPNNSTPSNDECTPCTNDGAVVCIGSKQFGLCNRGCAVAQDLAAGMSCSNGAVVASVKRHINFPRAHIHRRHSAARLI